MPTRKRVRFRVYASEICGDVSEIHYYVLSRPLNFLVGPALGVFRNARTIYFGVQRFFGFFGQVHMRRLDELFSMRKAHGPLSLRCGKTVMPTSAKLLLFSNNSKAVPMGDFKV